MERLKLDIQRFASGIVSLGTSGAMEGRVVWSSTVMGSTPAEKASLNKSLVTATVQVRRTYSWTQGYFTGNAVINGVSENYSSNVYVTTDWVTVKDNYSKEVSHNADGTRTTQVGGTITGPAGTSLEGVSVSNSILVTLDKIPRYATCNQSLKSKTETSITMNWSSDSTIDYVWYTTDGTAQNPTWVAVGSVNATSGSYTISNLSANTPYNIKTRVRRKDSQLPKDSDNLQVDTYDWPTLGGGSNFTLGVNTPLIQMNNPLYRPLTVTILTETNDEVKTIQNVTSSFRPEFTSAEIDIFYNSIPNKKSGTYKIKTVSSVNTNTKDARQYSVNENASKPTFSDFTYEDANSTTLALTGDSSIVVQNYSNVRARVSVANKAVAQNGTTMKQYNLVIGNAPQVSANYSDSEEVITPEVNNASSNIINLYAEDNRGLTTLASKTAVLKAYTNIQKGNISIARAGNVGKSVTLTFNGTFWNDSFGDVTNAITSVQYRYKTTSSSQWSSYISITPPTSSDNNYSFSGGIAGDLGNEGFTVDNSFNIEVVVSDRLSSTTFTVVLGTGTPLIAKHNNGVAIKQPYDTNDDSVLQVNGKTHLKGNTTITGDESVSGNLTTGTFNGKSWDFNTNNTTDTWVPVADSNGKWRHRAIPKMYNTNTPAIKMETIDGRISNANIAHTYENNKAHMQLLIATSSMTANKPAADGFITHYSWDNDNKCSAQLYVPQGDQSTKPIQFRTENNAGTWTSWENIYRAKTLYDNGSGTQGTVTLSESSTNFTMLEIFYRIIDGTQYRKSTRVWAPNGKRTELNYVNNDNVGNAWYKSKEINISGTSITVNGNVEVTMKGGSTTNTDRIYITQVIGYR